MKNSNYLIVSFCLLMATNNAFAQGIKQDSKSGNPLFPGWYADPEARIFNNTYWIFPTYSDDY